jgi:hypothetical protein
VFDPEVRGFSRLWLPLLMTGVALASTIQVCLDMAGEVGRGPTGLLVLIPGVLVFPVGLFLALCYVAPAMLAGLSFAQIVCPALWGVYAVLFHALHRTPHRRTYWRALVLLCVLLVLNAVGCYAPQVAHREFSTVVPQGRPPAALAGTWVFVSPVTGRNETGAGRRIRCFGSNSWYVAQLAPASDQVLFLFGGHYALDARTDTETVDYATPNLSAFLHQTFTYTVRLDDGTLTLDGRNGDKPVSGAADGVWQQRPIAPAALHEIEVVEQVLSAGASSDRRP